MYDDGTKVMDAQTWPNPRLRWERDARRDLGEALDQEPERLCWNAALVTPAQNAIDEKGLETL
jgi:hypothetical protein